MITDESFPDFLLENLSSVLQVLRHAVFSCYEISHLTLAARHGFVVAMVRL